MTRKCLSNSSKDPSYAPPRSQLRPWRRPKQSSYAVLARFSRDEENMSRFLWLIYGYEANTSRSVLAERYIGFCDEM